MIDVRRAVAVARNPFFGRDPRLEEAAFDDETDRFEVTLSTVEEGARCYWRILVAGGTGEFLGWARRRIPG